VYKLSDGKTGVLVVSTFDVEDEYGNPGTDVFIRRDEEGLQYSHQVR